MFGAGSVPQRDASRNTVACRRGCPGPTYSRSRLVALAARPAEKLVVRGQQLDLAAGEHPQLDTGALQRLSFDALLHDPAALRELGDVHVERSVM